MFNKSRFFSHLDKFKNTKPAPANTNIMNSLVGLSLAAIKSEDDKLTPFKYLEISESHPSFIDYKKIMLFYQDDYVEKLHNEIAAELQVNGLAAAESGNSNRDRLDVMPVVITFTNNSIFIKFVF